MIIPSTSQKIFSQIEPNGIQLQCVWSIKRRQKKHTQNTMKILFLKNLNLPAKIAAHPVYISDWWTECNVEAVETGG